MANNIKKKENLSLEDLKEKLMKKYRDNKYNIDENYEEKLHNNISIVFNYKFKNEYQSLHEINLYTELVSFLVKDFVLDTIHKVNDYISKKYKIDNFELKNRNDDRLFKGFLNEIDNLKRNQDGKLIKWISAELISQSRLIEKSLIIRCLDDFLRAEKIISNGKKKMNHLEFNLDGKYIIDLIQIFYEFKDKFHKNKFIGELNEITKMVSNELCRGINDRWIREGDQMTEIIKGNTENKDIIRITTIGYKNNKDKQKEVKKNNFKKLE